RGEHDQRNLWKQWCGCAHDARSGCGRLGSPDSQKLSAEESLTMPPPTVGDPLASSLRIDQSDSSGRNNNQLLVQQAVIVKAHFTSDPGLFPDKKLMAD